MAPESKSSGSGKNDLTQRFKTESETWIKDLSTEVLEDHVDTVSTLPVLEHIHGFDNEISFLENFLLDQKVYNEFKSLVVVGEFGVGKTALCQTMFNHAKVKSVYAPRIWVSMHKKERKEGEDNKKTEQKEDKRITVLKSILEGLGVEDGILKTIETEAEEERRIKQEAGERDGGMAQEKELSALLCALHLNLRWKKYLIVFDDVPKGDNWNENLGIDETKLEGKQWGTHLSDGFPKGSGGRVIYTTRDEALAKKLVAEKHEIHRLWPLTDSKHVWDIYKEALKEYKTIFRPPDKPHPGNEKRFKEELMNKSRGFPLAARMMAKSVPVFEDDSASNEPTDSANNPISEKV